MAGFDVYGSVAHQLETRLYMDFLRMEGEHNFLVLMPEDKRLQMRDFWYRRGQCRCEIVRAGPQGLYRG